MIRVRELSKRYGETLAVDRLDFFVPEGQVVGFLGPNGAGKSTTMRILTGLLHADEGSVEVAGVPVDPEDPASKARVGYLPESTPLYRRMRVAEYLDFVGRVRGLAPAARAEALARVLVSCGLTGWEGRRIATLSKGYRQRVGLAQALLADPEVLVLDEPTGGLDPTEVARIRELVRELGRTKTILLSTHVLSEVQEVCRRVIILARGRIVADGSPVELATQQRCELHLTLGAVGEDAAARLEAVEGVHGLRRLGEDDAGRVGFALTVEDRMPTAARLAELVSAAGWTLFELRHELPSLERVFLDRTQDRAETVR